MKPFLFILITALLTFTAAEAQYSNLLTPLSAKEKAMYKIHHVHIEKQQAGGNLKVKGAENSVRMFSPEGDLLGDFTYSSRRYYMYDNSGRVIKGIDSEMRADKSFDVTKYRVIYAPNTHPLQMVINKTWSSFTYEPDTRTLTETLSQDTPATTVYTYNDKGLLSSEKSYTKYRYLLANIKKTYMPNGAPKMEYRALHNTNAKDSMAVFYFYNNDGQLTSRQVFKTNAQIIEDLRDNHVVEAKHSEAGIFRYAYNDKGQLRNMEFTSSVSKILSYSIDYAYNDKGLLSTESRYYYHQPPLVLTYSYVYY